MSDKLLPCPFCGGTAELDPADDSERTWFVGCATCGCATDTSADRSTPAQEWNRRDASALRRVERETQEWAAKVCEERAKEISEWAHKQKKLSGRDLALARSSRDSLIGVAKILRGKEIWEPPETTANELPTTQELADGYVRVPRTGWQQDGNLLYRLKDGSNYDEINVSQAKGSRMLKDRTKRAAELLAMIQAAEKGE